MSGPVGAVYTIGGRACAMVLPTAGVTGTSARLLRVLICRGSVPRKDTTNARLCLARMIHACASGSPPCGVRHFPDNAQSHCARHNL